MSTTLENLITVKPMSGIFKYLVSCTYQAVLCDTRSRKLSIIERTRML